MQKRLSLALAATLLLTPALAQTAAKSGTPAGSTASPTRSVAGHTTASTRGMRGMSTPRLAATRHTVGHHAATVNVNSATLAQIGRLPGMTPRLARAVVRARAGHPFKNEADLVRRVKGLGAQNARRLAGHLKFA